LGQQWETDARSPIQYVTWQYTCPRCRPHLHLCKTEHKKGFRAAWNRPPQQKDSLLFRFIRPQCKFPSSSPVTSSPWRHSHWLYIGTPTSCNWLSGRSSMPFSWRSSIIMFCRNEAEDLDYSTLDCLCLYPAACATFPCRFFFSRSIKHPQAIVFVQFVRRPIMCSYEPWLHSFLNEGSKLLTSFCLPGFYTGK